MAEGFVRCRAPLDAPGSAARTSAASVVYSHIRGVRTRSNLGTMSTAWPSDVAAELNG